MFLFRFFCVHRCRREFPDGVWVFRVSNPLKARMSKPMPSTAKLNAEEASAVCLAGDFRSSCPTWMAKRSLRLRAKFSLYWNMERNNNENLQLDGEILLMDAPQYAIKGSISMLTSKFQFWPIISLRTSAGGHSRNILVHGLPQPVEVAHEPSSAMKS